VPGWKAKPTKVYRHQTILKSGKKKRYYADSFDVYDCPEFELMQYIKDNLDKPEFDTEEIKIALEKYQGLLKERESKNAEN
jgi:predicted secreted protein